MLQSRQVAVLPFIISLIGVVADFVTTSIGLGLGFYETNPAYHPVRALIIFWTVLTLLSLTLPKTKIWDISKNIFATTSFLGAVNNTIVILGVSSGLII